jgi:hypothetical protein
MEKLQNLQIKDNSKKVYLGIMKRMTKHGFKENTKQAKTMKYIKGFLSKFDKPSTKLDILNVILLINDDETLRGDIKKYRKTLQALKKNMNVKTMNEKGETLPTIDKFKEKLDSLFEDKKYKEYIVNYLMFHYGVRNQDVNVEVQKSKPKLIIQPTKNYLILKPKEIKYIRHDYRTAKTYGPQTIIIKDTEFMTAVKEVGEGFLFDESKQLGNELRKILIFKLSESDIFKMLIDSAYKNKDTERINELSKTRGTDINTIKENYHVNATDEIIKQI